MASRQDQTAEEPPRDKQMDGDQRCNLMIGDPSIADMTDGNTSEDVLPCQISDPTIGVS